MQVSNNTLMEDGQQLKVGQALLITTVDTWIKHGMSPAVIIIAWFRQEQFIRMISW